MIWTQWIVSSIMQEDLYSVCNSTRLDSQSAITTLMTLAISSYASKIFYPSNIATTLSLVNVFQFLLSASLINCKVDAILNILFGTFFANVTNLTARVAAASTTTIPNALAQFAKAQSRFRKGI